MQSANESKGFKLNYKRTIYIGLAFFTIMMLWQVYNTYCPLFLTDFFISNFGGSPTDHAYLVGIIMAMDNVLALLILPLFGAWSDRTSTKLGKRMPFIIVGVCIAVIVFPLIPIMFMYNQMLWMIIMMGIILVAMNIYRSPAVSLMPDITPKPIRSKANAIINVLGYIGGIFAGALGLFFKASVDSSTGRLLYDPNNIWIPFVATAILMVVALVILLLKIRENKISTEMASEMQRGERVAEVNEAIVEDKPLTGTNKRNMIILLLSIFLWFFAFNAIETFGSTYGTQVLGESTSWWSTAVIVMTICSIIGFVPGAYLSSKIGRRKTVIIGLCIMMLALAVAIFKVPSWVYYPLVGIAGIGWAWVNVNSYPMVVEMASKKNIGKLTGWYYTASMLAQSITPILVGFLFGVLGYEFLFPYAIIFSGVALIVFCLYKTPKHNQEVQTSQIEESNTTSATQVGVLAKDVKLTTKPKLNTTQITTKTTTTTVKKTTTKKSTKHKIDNPNTQNE